jgi:CheY-like chemotaxis protein
LSGHTRPEEREHCIALGASDFVSKPYDFKRLSKIVRGLLGVPEIATESTAITAPTATPEQLQALILQLEPLLLASNPRAQDVSLQLESACRGHAGATLAKRVRQELELYDFVAANKSFVKLKDEIRSDLCERNYD